MMRRLSTTLGILCAVLFLVCACDQSPKKSDAEISNEVRRVDPLDFNFGDERQGRRFGKRISALCNSISEISNKTERVVLLEKLAESISKLKLREYSPREKESMADDYWLSLEYVSYQLVQNGFDEQFVVDFIMNAFREFQVMCSSCGDANDFSDGKRPEATERRRCARALHGSWKNAVAFWEQHSIRTIFYGHPDAAERFRESWLKEFGSL